VNDVPGTPQARRRPPTRAELEANLHGLEARARATNDRINSRSGRNLVVAVIVGVLLGGILLASLAFAKELFMVFAFALVAITSFELSGALRSAGRDVPRTPLFIVSIAIIPLSFWGIPAIGLSRDGGHWLGLLAGVVLVTVWRLVELIDPKQRAGASDVVKDLMAGVLVLVYIAFLGSFTVLMTAQEGGEWWVLGFIIVVVSIDTGAYAAGLTFGRHKMAPTISPGKTWEGFAGSAVFAMVAGVLVAIFLLGEPWWVGVILAATMVLTATGGDLAESLIKRDLGVKDISTWLPGHGGVLDRLDSTLLSAPAAYALFLIVTSGTMRA
jgi:phosphatidate cytidylyltransferase